MAIHRFILKPGKGTEPISAEDIELISKDSSEELKALLGIIKRVYEELLDRLDSNTLFTSNDRVTVFNHTTNNNNVNYKLGYNADNQEVEFRFDSVQSILNTVKYLHINADTDNTINFSSGQRAIQIIVPSGKLPSMSGRGKTVHAQTLRTSDSLNLVYLSGDLDSKETQLNDDIFSFNEINTGKKWIDTKPI